METVLRISVADPNRDAIECFSKKIAPLGTSGPRGIAGCSAGLAEGPGRLRLLAHVIDKSLVQQKFEMIEAEAA